MKARARAAAKPRLSEWQLARMRHLREFLGLDYEAIGWLYGRRSGAEVREILRGGDMSLPAGKRAKRKTRNQRAHNSGRKRVPEELVAEMHALHLGGMNLSEVAERFGRTNATIRDLFRARGLAVLKQARRPYRMVRKRRTGIFRVPQELVAEMHALYLEGLSTVEIGRRFQRTAGTIASIFRARGLEYPIRRAYPKVMPKRVPADEVAAMHAFYLQGRTLAETGRKFGRSGKQVGHIFRDRGLAVRQTGRRPENGRRPDGTIAPYTPASPEVIEAAIAAATRIRIPDHLRLDWRKWSLERRSEFIERIRAKLNSPNDRPRSPFSANIRPFDYATRAAHEIAAAEAAAAGRVDSRVCPSKIKLCSQGVIWDGRLWFWSAKSGYSHGVWPNRTLLHRAIWERKHGATLDANDIVRMADGNPNNLDPSNLVLVPREQVLRENQASTLQRKSREQVTLLLQRHQNPDASHDLIASIRGRRHRRSR